MIVEKIERLSVREKVGLTLAVVFLFLCLIVIFVVRPAAKTRERLDVEIKNVKSRLLDDGAYVARGESVRSRYESVKGNFSEAVPKDQAIADMKGQIDDIARLSHVTIQSMEHREAGKTEIGDEYVVVVGSFEAAEKDVLGFLNEIQSAPGMLRIVKLNLKPGKNKASLQGSATMTKVMIGSGS